MGVKKYIHKFDRIVIDLDIYDIMLNIPDLRKFCSYCPLYNSDTDIVMPHIINEDIIDKKLLIISDYPGKVEKEMHLAYTGNVGKHVLDDLEKFVPDTQIRVINAVNHYVLPTDAEKEIKYCKPFIVNYIIAYAPDIIWFAGKLPYKMFKNVDDEVLDILYEKIGALKIEIPAKNISIPTILTINPALVFRNNWSEVLYSIYLKTLYIIRSLLMRKENKKEG